MENWKIQLVVMTFCVLVQTSQGSSSSTEEERRLSRHWQHQSMESAMTIPVESLMKRSKALRFYGLMGKREVTKKSFQPKKQSLGGVIPSATTREIHDPEKPYKQASLKEWIRILY
ncbi:uncharacterized protein V3H82_000843 [Fundulus diaphanus]